VRRSLFRRLAGTLALALAFVLPVHAAERAIPAWFLGDQMTLWTRDEAKHFEGQWQFHIYGGGDVAVTKHETTAGQVQDSQLIMLFDGVLLVQGVELQDAWAVGAFDAPALSLQMAVRLLQEAFPKGPESVGEDSAIAISEPKRTLFMATPTADATLGAPWTAEGKASRTGSGEVRFDLVARGRTVAGNDVATVAVPLKGTWQRAPAPARLDDGFSLEGWNAFIVSPMGEIRGERELVSGQKPAEAGLRTLGQLRRAVAEAKTR
jgi:hypothetical protein